MKGGNFTLFGLSLFGIGLLLLVVWTILYDKETDVMIEGKITPQGDTSKALLTVGSVILASGYALCVAGYAIASDFLNFSLKMPKNNLIEI
jgi:hypothetical protein